MKWGTHFYNIIFIVHGRSFPVDFEYNDSGFGNQLLIFDTVLAILPANQCIIF